MNEQQIDALLKSFDAAQQLMTMLNQYLDQWDCIVDKLGNEWVVTRPNYIERFASPVEAYRHALTIAKDGIPAQDNDDDTP